MWTGILASVLFLVLIAVERYHAVLYPLHHHTGMVVTRLKFIVASLCVYAFAWNIPTFVLLRHSNQSGRCYQNWPNPLLGSSQSYLVGHQHGCGSCDYYGLSVYSDCPQAMEEYANGKNSVPEGKVG